MVSFPDSREIIERGVVTHDKEKGYVRYGDWQDMTDARTCIEAAQPKIWKVVEPVLKEHSVKMDVALKATLFNSVKGLHTFVFPNAKTETHQALEVVHEPTPAAFKEAFTKSASVGIGAIENNEVGPLDTRLVAITDVWLNTRKYTPMKAGQHIPTPQWIINKKACVNPTNTGAECGGACLVMHRYYEDVRSGAILKPNGGTYRGKSQTDYRTYQALIEAKRITNPFNTAGIPGPWSLDDWERIEKLNPGLYVDVLTPTNRDGELRFLRCSMDRRRLEEGATEITVILLGDRNKDPEDDNNHYIFVKPGCLGRLVKDESSHHSSEICTFCHRTFDTRTSLKNHRQRHIDNQEFGVEVLPQGEDTELRMGKRPFKKSQSYNHSLQQDWWYVADSEAYLTPVPREISKDAAKEVHVSYQRDKHEPASYKLLRLQRVPKPDSDPQAWAVEIGATWDYADGDGDEAVMAHFHRTIQEDNEKRIRLERLLNEHNKEVSFGTPEAKRAHVHAARCHICNGVEHHGFEVLTRSEDAVVKAYWASREEAWADADEEDAEEEEEEEEEETAAKAKEAKAKKKKRLTFDEWVKARYAEDPEGEAAARVAMEKASFLRVRDHDHMIWAPGSDIPEEIMGLYEELNLKPVFGANYRGAAHSRCNREYTAKRAKTSCFFHNLTGYDGHHLLFHAPPETGKDFSGISLNSQKMLSFSLKKVEFKDSLAFLGAGVSALGKELRKDAEKNLPLTMDSIRGMLKERGVTDPDVVEEALSCVTRKGIWPYTWFTDRSKFAATELPPIDEFENLSESDYKHGQRVWRLFNCKTMRDFHDLYIALDVYIVADAMQGLREDSLKHFKLEPLWFYGVPGLAYDAALNTIHHEHPGQGIELLSDMQHLDHWERSKRGGRTDVNVRYTKANNKYLRHGRFDPSKPSTYIRYFDMNNLYGWAMQQSLPVGGYRMESADFDWRSLSDDGPRGALLHDLYRSFPPVAVGNVTPTFDMFGPLQQTIWGDPKRPAKPTLLGTLERVTKYSCHYRFLKEVESIGVVVSRVHEVQTFDQAPVLRAYINKCTAMRTAEAAKGKDRRSDRLIAFFKLMANSLYGKMVENVRGRSNMQFADRYASKYLNMVKNPAFINEVPINAYGSLLGVNLLKEKVQFDKPIPIGVSVLDLSKMLVVRFWYN
jgi:hypothetical protein